MVLEWGEPLTVPDEASDIPVMNALLTAWKRQSVFFPSSTFSLEVTETGTLPQRWEDKPART